MPAGYIPCDFLESTGTQYIQTALMQSDEDVYTLNMDNTTRQNYLFGARAAWNSKNIGLSYEPAHKRWVVGWGNANNYDSNYSDARNLQIEYKKGYFTVNGITKSFPTGSGVPIHPLALFAVNQAGSPLLSNGVLIRRFQVVSDGAARLDFIPALDPQGVPYMYDQVTKQPFYNSGTGSFIAGFTLAQARNLRKLPATGGSLTVSLPWEAQLVQHNADVESALQTAKNNGWTITVQYREPEADSAVYNKYAACYTVEDMQAVNPDYQNDLTAAGEWIYPLPKLEDATRLFQSFRKIKAFSADAPNLIKANNMLGFTTVAHIKINMPLVTSLYYFCGDGYPLLTFETTDLSLVTDGYEAFKGCGQLRSFEYSLPSLSNGTRMFLSTILDKASVLCILNSLPAYTSGVHNLTIGIHIDHQTDEEVLAAIANAEAKGWTVAAQWNGTATAAAASTFGLRAPSIYAKLDMVERPNGRTENVLDWGHYVTNWEENGYQEFGSVEEAEEHFNIKQTEEA